MIATVSGAPPARANHIGVTLHGGSRAGSAVGTLKSPCRHGWCSVQSPPRAGRDLSSCGRSHRLRMRVWYHPRWTEHRTEAT